MSNANVNPNIFVGPFDPTPPGSPTAQSAHRVSRRNTILAFMDDTPPSTPTNPTRAAEHRINKLQVTARLSSGLSLVNVLNVQHPVTTSGFQTPQAVRNTPLVAPTPGRLIPNVPMRPRVGGIDTSQTEPVAWTGGGAAQPLQGPRSTDCYRHTDIKERAKVEQRCTQGLELSMRLGMPETASNGRNISLLEWMEEINKAMQRCGMDTPFRIMVDGSEINILSQYGHAGIERISNHVNTINLHGCEYDAMNLIHSGEFIMKSLDLDMLRMVKHELLTELTGPEVFAAVISIHQNLNTTSSRHLQQELLSFSLKNEPGENVITLCNKVQETADKMVAIAAGRPIDEFIPMIFEPFLRGTNTTFKNIVDTAYNKSLDNHVDVRNWKKVLNDFKNGYRQLWLKIFGSLPKIFAKQH